MLQNSQNFQFDGWHHSRCYIHTTTSQSSSSSRYTILSYLSSSPWRSYPPRGCKQFKISNTAAPAHAEQNTWPWDTWTHPPLISADQPGPHVRVHRGDSKTTEPRRRSDWHSTLRLPRQLQSCFIISTLLRAALTMTTPTLCLAGAQIGIRHCVCRDSCNRASSSAHHLVLALDPEFY